MEIACTVALINSRLDYCNSLINNISKKIDLNSNVQRIVYHAWYLT